MTFTVMFKTERGQFFLLFSKLLIPFSAEVLSDEEKEYVTQSLERDNSFPHCRDGGRVSGKHSQV